MPDDDDRGGRGRPRAEARGRGGDGGGDGAKKREDSAFEVGLSIAIERVAGIIGRPVGTLLSGEVLSRLKGVARGKQIVSALKTLGPVVEVLFGDDEEVRAAIRGTFDGLAKGVEGVEEGEVVGKINTLLEDSSPITAQLTGLAKAGRLEAARMLPFEEAFIKLNAEQRLVIRSLAQRIGGDCLKMRSSAVGLQGIAEMLLASKWDPKKIPITDKDPIVEEFRARFAPPVSEVKKKVGEVTEALQLIERHLKAAIDDGSKSGVPFATRVAEGTGARAAGLNTYEAFREKMRARQSPPGLFTRLRTWWQDF